MLNHVNNVRINQMQNRGFSIKGAISPGCKDSILHSILPGYAAMGMLKSFPEQASVRLVNILGMPPIKAPEPHLHITPLPLIRDDDHFSIGMNGIVHVFWYHGFRLTAISGQHQLFWLTWSSFSLHPLCLQIFKISPGTSRPRPQG